MQLQGNQTGAEVDATRIPQFTECVALILSPWTLTSI